MSYVHDNRVVLFEFLENEELLEVNMDKQIAGPGATGMCQTCPSLP